MPNKDTTKIIRIMSLIKHKNETISAKCESKIKSTLSESKMDSPCAIEIFMNKHFNLKNKSEEYAYMLCLNNKLRLTHIFEVSHGDIATSLLSPYQIAQRAFLTNSQRIILVHNHPSGDETPSREDINVTKSIIAACELMKIIILDHIIIADRYYSIKENCST